MIQYKIINGSIPEGSRVISDRGVMKITGVAPLDASFNPPVFSGDNKLPNADEFDEINIPLDIAAQGEKALVGSTVIRGSMPWGLILDGATISGTVAQLNQRVAVDFSEEEAPKWSTKEGLTGNFTELQTIDPITLEVDRPVKYSIVKGTMAWGLSMTTDGVISGKVMELNNSTDIEPAGPGPLFDTARGRLGVYNEQAVIPTVEIRAIPRTGSNIYLRIISGHLPWGLSMDVAGNITGKVNDLNIGGAEDTDSEVPVITASAWTGAVGSVFSKSITYATPLGRTATLQIVNGYLPFGFILDGNTISGTTTVPGIYTFTVVATDNTMSKSTPTTFTIEVTA